MKKQAVAVLMTAVMSLSVFGVCANAEETEDTRVITDIFGREVELPAEVETVAALGSAARLMCYAGVTDKLIGVTESDLDPQILKPYSYIYADELAECGALATGGSEDSSYVEAVVAADPDVIFYFDSDPVATEELAEKTGLPVVGIYAKNCFDQTFYDSLDLIGEILDVSDRTTELVTSLKGWAEDLDSRTKDVPEEEKPSVYVGAVNWNGEHGMEGSYVQYLPLEAINAKNLVNELGDEEGYMEISLEQVTEWDPDVIFLTIANMGLINENYAENPEFYDALSAVQNGQVYSQVSFNYYWCNLELAVIDAYYAGTVLYPEQFADINFEEKADEIFETMLGSPFLAEMVESGNEFCPLTIGE